MDLGRASHSTLEFFKVPPSSCLAILRTFPQWPINSPASNTYPDGSQMNISSSDLSSELQTPYPTAHLIAPLGPNLWPSFQMWSCSSLLYLHATNINCLSQKLGNFLSNPWQFLPAPASLFPMSNRLFSPADFTSKVALEFIHSFPPPPWPQLLSSLTWSNALLLYTSASLPSVYSAARLF